MVVEVSVVRDGVDGLHYDAVHPQAQRRGQAMLSEGVAVLSHLISYFINLMKLIKVKLMIMNSRNDNEWVKRMHAMNAK